MPFKVVRFLLRNYYTLHYFEELVVQYGVHYDRRHFRRIYETFPVYCLFQYRSLYPGKQHSKRYLNYPLTIQSHPAHLRFQSLFFLFFAARCFAISCIGWATDTEWKRIAIGTEFIAKEGGFFIETTFFLWSAIAVLYFRFSLTSSILDYKCLAVLRISPKRPEYLLPSALGKIPIFILLNLLFKNNVSAYLDLTRGQLLRLYRFRRLAALFLHSTIISISTLGPASVVILYLRTPLYFTHTTVSAFWTAVMVYWIYAMSALLYTNLIPFIVVAKYLHIKQQAIAGSLENSLGQLCRGGGVLRGGLASNHQLQLNRSFLEASTRYAHLQDELEEYGRFWRPYLTFIFVLYVLLIGFILFILLLTDFLLLGKATYGIVLDQRAGQVGPLEKESSTPAGRGRPRRAAGSPRRRLAATSTKHKNTRHKQTKAQKNKKIRKMFQGDVRKFQQ